MAFTCLLQTQIDYVEIMLRFVVIVCHGKDEFAALTNPLKSTCLNYAPYVFPRGVGLSCGRYVVEGDLPSLRLPLLETA